MIDNVTYDRLHPKVDDESIHDRRPGRFYRADDLQIVYNYDSDDQSDRSTKESNDPIPEGIDGDHVIVLYPPTVIGYNMRLKKWGQRSRRGVPDIETL